jgi:transcriptional regulator with XRE-family HTH domain
MFRHSVNMACNNSLFALRTMAGMKKPKAIHASIGRLYAVATETGDDTPAKVARRLNVSAQTLNNWETRGISQAGAVIAQGVYGCSAAWVVTGRGERSQARGTAPASHSQLVRLDPAMIAETHRALRLLEDKQDRIFSLENSDYAAQFVQLYRERVGMSAQPTVEEWVAYVRKLETITTPQGASDGRTDGVPTHGTGKGKMARKVHR